MAGVCSTGEQRNILGLIFLGNVTTVVRDDDMIVTREFGGEHAAQGRRKVQSYAGVASAWLGHSTSLRWASETRGHAAGAPPDVREVLGGGCGEGEELDSREEQTQEWGEDDSTLCC